MVAKQISHSVSSQRRKMINVNLASSCAEGEKRCGREPMCVPAGSVCDGVADCTVYKSYWSEYNSGGNDEESCSNCTSGAIVWLFLFIFIQIN